MTYKVYKRISQYPYAFTWSPYLAPKPKDWGTNVDIVGTIRLPEDYVIPHYVPETDFNVFIASGTPR